MYIVTDKIVGDRRVISRTNCDGNFNDVINSVKMDSSTIKIQVVNYGQIWDSSERRVASISEIRPLL